MNARFYVVGIGRFASADSIIPDPINPQNFNRFSYVLNNPINRIDPTGHISCDDLGTEECVMTDDGSETANYVDPYKDKDYEYWQARADAQEYYWANFSNPFNGEQRLTSQFGPGHPDGVDWGGGFEVLAPAPGTVTRAGSDSPAGMWQIQNIETGEIRTYGAGVLRESDRGEDGLLEPERLLSNGQWQDISPGWSHSRGTIINIEHGHNLQTRYYHLNIETSIIAGSVVEQGDIIAITANNGWSTGVHLHYGVLFEFQGQGEWLDPIQPVVSSGGFE